MPSSKISANDCDNSLLPTTGGMMGEGAEIKFKVYKTGTCVTGLRFFDKDENVVGGMGSYSENGETLKLFLGLGENFWSAPNGLSLTDEYIAWKNKKLYGEHNKPSGSYTGNGSATTRQINTGGVGNVVYIAGNGYGAIVTLQGAIVFAYDGRAITMLSNSKVFFSGGALTIATDEVSLNASGKEFIYQVL